MASHGKNASNSTGKRSRGPWLGGGLIVLALLGGGLVVGRGGDSATAKSGSVFEAIKDNAATGRAQAGEAIQRAQHPRAGIGTRGEVEAAANRMAACLKRALGPQANIEVTTEAIRITGGGANPDPVPESTGVSRLSSSVELDSSHPSLDLSSLELGVFASSGAAQKSCDEQAGYSNAKIDWESSPSRRAERKAAATKLLECLGGEAAAKDKIDRLSTGADAVSAEVAACMSRYGVALELERPVR